jgi:hypothetical protein
LTVLEDTKLSIPIMISVQECSQNNRFNWKFFKPEDLPVVPWSSEDWSRQPTLSYNSQSRVYPAVAIQENRAFIDPKPSKLQKQQPPSKLQNPPSSYIAGR